MGGGAEGTGGARGTINNFTAQFFFSCLLTPACDPCLRRQLVRSRRITHNAMTITLMNSAFSTGSLPFTLVALFDVECGVRLLSELRRGRADPALAAVAHMRLADCKGAGATLLPAAHRDRGCQTPRPDLQRLQEGAVRGARTACRQPVDALPAVDALSPQ